MIRPALHVIGPAPGVSRVAGAYLMVLNGRAHLLADPTVNFDPTAEQLADIAIMAADKAREFAEIFRLTTIRFGDLRTRMRVVVRGTSNAEAACRPPP